MDEPKKDEVGTGEETKAERFIGTYPETVIHLFLSALAFLLLIAAYDTVIRDFPALWQTPQDEYTVPQQTVAKLLLIAIAAEFALLLLFHRMSAAVEFVIFVIARKTVRAADHRP